MAPCVLSNLINFITVSGESESRFWLSTNRNYSCMKGSKSMEVVAHAYLHVAVNAPATTGII